jgi:hypothetical protein
VIYLNGAPIAYRSKRQTFAVGSSCESEIVALSSVVKEVQAITRQLTDLGIRNEGDPPVVVLEDNAAALSHCYDDISQGRTKALDLRWAIARQGVQRGIIDVQEVRSKNQIADIMCKQAPRPQFEAMRDVLLGMSMDDVKDDQRSEVRTVSEQCGAECFCSDDLDDARERATERARAIEELERSRRSRNLARGEVPRQSDERATEAAQDCDAEGAHETSRTKDAGGVGASPVNRSGKRRQHPVTVDVGSEARRVRRVVGIARGAKVTFDADGGSRSVSQSTANAHGTYTIRGRGGRLRGTLGGRGAGRGLRWAQDARGSL